MKKVFAILAVASFVSFTSCKNAPKEDVIVEEVVLVDEELEEGEEVEEAPECATK